ncbi:hypothetical protein [Methanolobus chelungpuianus]|uniref:Uncharacterized protein n=1 Tax=Methanolobus chelungpuianus TaxID=502115 RepID=A0AAE3HA80_9EURY|nr:hypothetical protein [Methanolobus chelungpuianus]MCQ6962418.1 hypothetical protein [Methanolobus chelungpuianus]
MFCSVDWERLAENTLYLASFNSQIPRYMGLYSFFVRLDLAILFTSTAALLASIGMLGPKYVRSSRFMPVFFISAAGISSYCSAGNPHIALLAILFFLLAILQEFKLSKGLE